MSSGYELYIKWEDGNEEVYTYETSADAARALVHYEKAFGSQIEYITVRPHYV